MRLLKFLQRLLRQRKPKDWDWSQRVSFWPSKWPHRIATYADVTAVKHLMVTSGIPGVVAIDHLVRDEEFWWDLGRFFQSKIDELDGGEVWIPMTVATIRRVPLLFWEDTV